MKFVLVGCVLIGNCQLINIRRYLAIHLKCKFIHIYSRKLYKKNKTKANIYNSKAWHVWPTRFCCVVLLAYFMYCCVLL